MVTIHGYFRKGSRGLSVLPRVCGIFTTTTISQKPYLCKQNTLCQLIKLFSFSSDPPRVQKHIYFCIFPFCLLAFRRRLYLDRSHIPGPDRCERRFAIAAEQRYPHAVRTSRINTLRHTLTVIGKDFQNCTIDKNP